MIRRIWNRVRRWLWLGPLLLIAVVLALGIYGYGLQAARVDALAAALGDEQDAAEDRGETPVAPNPTSLLDNPSYEGPPGPSGPPGKDGADGRSITDAECLGDTWVLEYSDGTTDYSAGDCTGDAGPTGEPGSNGIDGAPGSPGPPGSDGQDGADGTDGVGIANAECNPETGRWVITYTNGRIDEDAGPCRTL